MAVNIYRLSLIQGIVAGLEIYWKGDLIEDDDWGFDINLDLIRVSYIYCSNSANLPEYGFVE